MSQFVTVIAFPFRVIILALVAIVTAIWWTVTWVFHGMAWPFTRFLDGVGHAYPAVLRRGRTNRVPYWSTMWSSTGANPPMAP